MLDEPSLDTDPKIVIEIILGIRFLNKESGISVILVE